MGNKWEKDSERIISKENCPCGKGAYIVTEIHYIDDYLREHISAESELTCEYCRNNYEYLGNRKWITKDSLEILKSLRNDKENYEKNIYDELYCKAKSELYRRCTTKKALYEFLEKNEVGRLPGTLGTFYKHGPDYYIGKGRLNLDDIIKLIYLLNINSYEIEKKIDEYKNKCEKINLFIKENSIIK